VREAGLVTIATRGIVFAPGRAGTLQEIFMDAAQNFYGSEGLISPMVLLDSAYWRETLPVAPLLERLAGNRPMSALIAVLDDPRDAIAFLESTGPSLSG